jgi:hypothetical protein
MAKPNLARTPFKIGYVDLMNPRLFGKVDLSPASLLAELPNSVANLDANIGVHSSSIDLVETLYLVDALSRSKRAEPYAAVASPGAGNSPLTVNNPVRTANKAPGPKILGNYETRSSRQLRPTLC